MAAKIKMLTLLQEIRGFAQMANRSPAPRSPGLFLAQFRSEEMLIPLHKRKLSITINEPNQSDIPLQVRIQHVKHTPHSAAMAPAP
jgi:hypothetical protein